MEQKVNVWKSNLTNGLLLGLAGIVYTLILYFFDQSTNKSLGNAFMIIQLIVLFLLMKSYRDNFMHGMITYGQAVGAGVIICLYSTVIMAVFSYILYAFIDPGLIDKMIAMSEEAGLKKGYTQEQIDMGMKFTKKIMNPPVLAAMSVFIGMFMGTIMSLILAIFVRKEGNPLIDTPEN